MCATPDQGSHTISAARNQNPNGLAASRNCPNNPLDVFSGPSLNELDLQARQMSRRQGSIFTELLIGQGLSQSISTLWLRCVALTSVEIANKLLDSDRA